MFYYKEVIDGKLVSFGAQNIKPVNFDIITESEYLSLKAESELKYKRISEYAEKVKNGEITMEEVPEEYREKVEFIINPPEPEQAYTLDEAAEIIAQEVKASE